MLLNSKNKFLLILIIVSFLAGFIFIKLSKAESNQTSTQKASGTTRIIISTSGPVKFGSHWLDNPDRLIIEFKSRNVVANIENEMVVDQGVIKKITSSYFENKGAKTLKTLTFELIEKVPYKIWQEGNSILLDIQSSLETNGFSIGNKVNSAETEATNVIKRLEAMDAALKQTQGAHSPLELRPLGPSANLVTVTNKISRHAESVQTEQGENILTEAVKVGKNKMSIIFWLAGLVLISSLGFLIWRKYAIVKTKNLNERIKKLKLQLEEKDKLLGQMEIIRKAIEKTAIEKEKEHGQLKLELDEKSKLFEQEATILTEKEKALQELEKEHTQLKETSESLKDVLVKRGIAKELTLPEEKGELWISGKSSERRNTPRLVLTKDFNNTVIVKIELPGIAKQIKSFAENISSGGLCFETAKELDDREAIGLRLFFYGGKVPNFRTQGWIAWEKTQDSKNYYGLTFDGLSEKVKSELEHYIESNIPKR